VEKALKKQASAYTSAEMSEEWSARITEVITVTQVCGNYVVDDVYTFLCWKWLWTLEILIGTVAAQFKENGTPRVHDALNQWFSKDKPRNLGCYIIANKTKFINYFCLK
jgi:hypothetical protein